MADYETVQDALYTQPIISLNGPREDLGIDANDQYGAGLDLRGLGVGATLVLVNGQRQPLSGLNGDFVDVSTIPLSAVERIEVLPDGASALTVRRDRRRLKSSCGITSMEPVAAEIRDRRRGAARGGGFAASGHALERRSRDARIPVRG